MVIPQFSHISDYLSCACTWRSLAVCVNDLLFVVRGVYHVNSPCDREAREEQNGAAYRMKKKPMEKWIRKAARAIRTPFHVGIWWVTLRPIPDSQMSHTNQTVP